tara:strand:- start:3066 stop:3347 length:282 start_codon:yes stop_codon:yes gene_type:complete
MIEIVENKKQILPKWFKGEIYDKGNVVENPYTGQTFYLNNVELSMYDFIKGSEIVLESFNFTGSQFDKTSNEMSKGLSWFRTYNSQAYIKLLD